MCVVVMVVLVCMCVVVMVMVMVMVVVVVVMSTRHSGLCRAESPMREGEGKTYGVCDCVKKNNKKKEEKLNFTCHVRFWRGFFYIFKRSYLVWYMWREEGGREERRGVGVSADVLSVYC